MSFDWTKSVNSIKASLKEEAAFPGREGKV